MATKTPGNKRFNERSSPHVKNRKLQALQILCNLRRENHSAMNEALDKLGFDDSELGEVMETLFQELIDDGVLEECGGCGGYHRKDFGGECRNNDERFPSWS
jgi:hypothetical protein